MKVQKVKLKNNVQPSWIVIGDDYLPIQPINEYLFFLHSVGRSPYTIRSYAYRLKLFWEYLHLKKIDWKDITVKNIVYFIALLNGLIEDNSVDMELKQPKRSARTINQTIVAIANFYKFMNQLGHISEIQFFHWKKSFFTDKSFKPLLQHLSKANKQRVSLFKLKENKPTAQILDAKTIEQMISACHTLRDKLLLCLLYETGCRIGQALGLRHEDVETYDNAIIIRPRDDNTNLMRAKISEENRLYVSKSLMQLYSDYFIHEYGDIDSDYVFINLWKGKIGKPVGYNAVITLFQRLGKKLGIHVTPHMFRHTHATELIKAGWNMAYVQKRLGHQSIQTTINIYTHITDQDLKMKFQTYLAQKGGK